MVLNVWLKTIGVFGLVAQVGFPVDAYRQWQDGGPPVTGALGRTVAGNQTEKLISDKCDVQCDNSLTNIHNILTSLLGLTVRLCFSCSSSVLTTV